MSNNRAHSEQNCFTKPISHHYAMNRSHNWRFNQGANFRIKSFLLSAFHQVHNTNQVPHYKYKEMDTPQLPWFQFHIYFSCA